MANVSNLTIKNLPEANLTVKVRIAKSFLWRFHIGLWLMKLGAIIVPVNVKVKASDCSNIDFHPGEQTEDLKYPNQ